MTSSTSPVAILTNPYTAHSGLSGTTLLVMVLCAVICLAAGIVLISGSKRTLF